MVTDKCLAIASAMPPAPGGVFALISALVKAFAQLGDRRLQGALWLSLATTAALLAGVAWLSWQALFGRSLFGITLFDAAFEIVGIMFAALLALFLFASVVPSVAALFLESVAAAVEARHYPNLGPARRQPITETLYFAIKFFAVMAGLNLLAVPLYLVLGLNVIVFYLLNGYLFGREYFEMVALRRCDGAAMAVLRRAHRGRLFFAGVILTLLFSIPLLNLLMPIVATGFMVHLLHGFLQPSANTPSHPKA